MSEPAATLSTRSSSTSAISARSTRWSTPAPSSPRRSSAATVTTSASPASWRCCRTMLGGRSQIDAAVSRRSEERAARNRAIAYLALDGGMIDSRVEEHLDLYFAQCSVLVSARDLAVMAATLANHGVNPITGARARGALRRVRPERHAELRHVRTIPGNGRIGWACGEESGVWRDPGAAGINGRRGRPRAGVPPAAEAIMWEASYSAGAAIIREGDAADALFLLAEGRVSVWLGLAEGRRKRPRR